MVNIPTNGWRRNVLAMVLGVCATLTLPPVHLFPLAVLAYGGLFRLLNHASGRKRALADGFFWGWGFYISGLYWFCIALMTDPEKFAWLLPLALLALTALIALSTVVFAVAYYQLRTSVIRQRSPVIAALLFAALWLLVEYARGHVLTGFPWNLAGYAFNVAEAPLQLASVVGIYGLTLLTVLLSVLSVTGKRHVVGVLMVLSLIYAWGSYRLSHAPTEYVEGVKLRLVQANIAQHHKWDPALQMQGLREHMLLTQSAGLESITHVIWPETAVPYAVREHSTLTKRLGDMLLPGQHLMTGALRVQDITADDFDLYNSVVMINDQGQLVAQYDKHKLVPFGEFLPLRSLIPKGWSTPVGDRDFAHGPANQTLRWPGLPALTPLVCYEVIFPHLAFGGDSSPQLLLSLTNDAWFGRSSAPYQHLAMARMRAVEQGIPMVRVANTGISAVYDGYGREVGRIDLGKKAFIDVSLPQQSQNSTFFRANFN